MSGSISVATQSNADALKCFKRRRRGADKIFWWAILGNVYKTNTKSATSLAKIAKQSAQKLENWCKTLKRHSFNIWM